MKKHGLKQLAGGEKNKSFDKPIFACLPVSGLLALGHVAKIGRDKHGLFNYKEGIRITTLLDAAFRHLIAATNREEVDPVDGNNHLASVAWNCLVALDTIINHPELDDRYKNVNTRKNK